MQHPSMGAQKAQRESVMAAKADTVMIQQEADVAHQAALVTEWAEVTLLEGPGMRAEIQGKVRTHPVMNHHGYRYSNDAMSHEALLSIVVVNSAYGDYQGDMSSCCTG